MRLGGFGLVAVLALGCASSRPAEAPALTHAIPVAGAIDAAELLAPAKVAAEAVGAGDFEPLGARVMVEGEQLGTFVAVPDASCLLALARGGEAVRDVDLHVYDDAGDRLAADESPNPGAAVIVCPPHPRRVYVAARLVSGDGMLGVGIMTVTVAEADAVAQAVEARGRPGSDTGNLASWPGLERRIRERREGLGGRWEDLRRLALPLDSGAPSVVSFPVEARRCVDVLIAPNDEVRGLEATVVDRDGRVIARGRPPGQDRAFVICSAADQELTLSVRPRRSSGLAAVIVSRSAEGAHSALSDQAMVSGATPLSSLDEALVAHGKSVASLRLSSPRDAGTGRAEVGMRRVLPLDLQAGCSRIDVVGGAPLGRFTASLWSPQDRRLGQAGGGEVATLFSCGDGGKATLEVRAEDRAGPFGVRVAHEPRPAASLLAYPEAGVVLLSRIEAIAGPIDVAAAAGTEVLLAPSARRVTREMAIAEGCADVVLVSADGGGLTMELGDGDGRRASRGERVVSDLVCAGDGVREVSFWQERGSKVLLLVKGR